ncbi:MAG: hypothetical protein ACPGQQ_09045 [Candidatus Puniceispirillaceae bacterium]
MTEQAQKDQLPKLDPERKYKVLMVAKAMKKSCYHLQCVWLEDAERWALVCHANINGVPYHAANFLDDFEVNDHADLFRHAFSEALKDVEQRQKSQLITIH